MSPAKFSRVFHRWASLVVALPVLVVILTGFLLLLKKDVAWIQPPTQRGSSEKLTLSFDRILAIARTVPEAEIKDWADVDRLDVRPARKMLKVRANNRWEIQLDAGSGEILQVAYRRSDLIESLHDGSFF
nr:PepSY domain-containing protein [Akkermansiaceae bacterium]